MQKLTRSSLSSLEDYARNRETFRARVLEHKKHRQLPVGPNATLYFEDALTMRYQVQEMLRAERIFESDEIEQELAAYNPLIPDGTNWKATFMLEYEDVAERREALERLLGIENRVWVRVDDLDTVFAIADEDMERATQEKTSAVHFLRFELSPDMCSSLKEGAALSAGIDHPHYRHEVSPVPAPLRKSLLADLD